MTTTEFMRVAWHVGDPVCTMRSGIRRHLALISIEDLGLLCRFFGTNIAELEDRFWQWIKIGRRRQKDCRNCNGRVGGCNIDGLCESLTPLEQVRVRGEDKVGIHPSQQIVVGPGAITKQTA